MKYSGFTLIIILALIIQTGFLMAQTHKGGLEKGKTVQKEIAPGENHRYDIQLEKDQFVLLKVIQQGVDLKVSTYDVSGERIEEFDSPNGKNGPELVTIKTEKKGTYALEIYPFDEKEPEGKYELSIDIIKPKAHTPGERVDELFFAWDSEDAPGASVAVVKNGELIYKKGYGMANLEYDIPNGPSTVFHIASVSKQFTVFSILLLQEKGLLSLDDDIRKHIPEVPDFGSTITLRHLASHTSGLRDQWNLLAMAGWRLDDVITKEHVLTLVSRQKELNFQPGEEFLYCNTGFTLLAEVVARVADQSFADFTRTQIFEPLNMHNTLFYDDHEKIVKNRAYSYYRDGSGNKKSVLNYANVGATSLFTTVEDLSLWAMNFSDPKIGNPGMISTMNTPAKLNSGQTIGGALGQFVGKYKGLNEIQHGGADAGYRSYLTRFPDQDFSVAVFSNAAAFNPGGMAHRIVDIYLEDLIEKSPEEEDQKEMESDDPISVDQDILETYLGDFQLRPDLVIGIKESGGKLIAAATGQPDANLIPQTKTEFALEGLEIKIEFIPNEGEKVKLLKLHQGGMIFDAFRVLPFDASALNLSDYSGTYYSEELGTEYQFTLKEDKLVATHIRLGDISLNPTKEDMFSGEAWFFSQIEFVRDENQSITGCKVSAGRVRNVWFSKSK
jgi:CubicO group peptidase (beta-lactamase class C family)